MEPRRRRELLLAGFVVVLGAVLYVTIAGWPRGTSVTPPPASNGQTRTARNDRPGPSAADAPGVNLGALEAERSKPDPAGRNLFRFKPKPPPPPPPASRDVRPVEEAPVALGPPPPPPITLKFIGIAGQSGKVIAVLSDGRGPPVYGHEGETVLGQYRILRIGAESIEMSYLDGRGRQTIRLSGS